MGGWQLKTLKDGTQAYRYQGDDGKWYKNDEEGNTGPQPANPTPAPITDRELPWDERMRYALAADKPATQLDALKRLGYGAEEQDGEVIAIDPKTGERFRPDSNDLNWKDALDLPAMIPEIAGQTAGAMGGAAIGALATGGAGAVPGGYAGQAVGSGLGTAARQKLAQWAGVEDPERDWKDRATDIGVSTLAGGLVPMAAEKVALPAIKWGAQAVKGTASKIPDLGIASAIKDTALEKTFNVPAKSVKQAFGPGGKELAERVAKGDTMLETATRLVGAPQKVVKDAGKQYAALRDQVISKDVWADPDPIIKVFNDGLKTVTEKGPNGETKIVGVLKADMDAFNETRKLVQRMATNAKSGATKGYGGMSAEYLYGLRKQADGLLKARGVYRKMEVGDDIGPVDKLLLDIRNAMEDEVENTAERYYGTTAGPEAKQAYIAAKEQYRMALELANQLGASFGIRSKKIGDKVIFNLADAGRVAQTLRNITNTPKEAQSILLKDLGRIAPEFSGDVEDVFKFAEAKPWMQSETSQTGKILRPFVAGSMGGAMGSALGPVGTVAGFGAGLMADAALAPKSAIKSLPAIGQAVRNAGAKKAAMLTAAKGAALPPIRSAVSAAAPRIASMEAQRIPQIGNPSRSVEIDQSPRELMGDKWADAQKVITTAYGRDVKALIDAGESPEEATAQVLRALAQKHRYNAKNLPGTFAGVVKQVQAAAKEQYGQDITRSQAIELLAGAQ